MALDGGSRFVDEDGFLTLKDRSKDMIISGGTNIYPREIEEVLLTHPGVRECAVIGAPHPDWGEEVVAFVVRQPGEAAAAGKPDDDRTGSDVPEPDCAVQAAEAVCVRR